MSHYCAIIKIGLKSRKSAGKLLKSDKNCRELRFIEINSKRKKKRVHQEKYFACRRATMEKVMDILKYLNIKTLFKRIQQFFGSKGYTFDI